MDREIAMQSLKDLLAELPAEFSYSVPGAHEPRSSFKVTKKRNTLRIHQSLWNLQRFFGLQSEAGHHKGILEPTVVDDDMRAIAEAYERGQNDTFGLVRDMVRSVESGQMSKHEFFHVLKGYTE